MARKPKLGCCLLLRTRCQTSIFKYKRCHITYASYQKYRILPPINDGCVQRQLSTSPRTDNKQHGDSVFTLRRRSPTSSRSSADLLPEWQSWESLPLGSSNKLVLVCHGSLHHSTNCCLLPGPEKAPKLRLSFFGLPQSEPRPRSLSRVGTREDYTSRRIMLTSRPDNLTSKTAGHDRG